MFEETEARGGPITAGAVRTRLVTGRSILRVKSWASGFAKCDSTFTIANVELPSKVGATAAGELQVFCTGPSDWLIIAPGQLSSAARGAIEAGCACHGLALADLSSALAVFEITGTASRQVLIKGCGLDLDPRVFVHPQCARTRLGQVAVLIATDGEESFNLYVARSHRQWLGDWLHDAALEFR